MREHRREHDSESEFGCDLDSEEERELCKQFNSSEDEEESQSDDEYDPMARLPAPSSKSKSNPHFALRIQRDFHLICFVSAYYVCPEGVIQ